MNPVIFPIKDSGQEIRKNQSKELLNTAFDYGSAALCSVSLVAVEEVLGRITRTNPDLLQGWLCCRAEGKGIRKLLDAF